MPEEVVRDIVYFYWKEVRKQMSMLEAARVYIVRLGWFDIKHWRLKYTIKDYEGMLSHIDVTESLVNAKKASEIQDKLTNVLKIQQIVGLELEKKKDKNAQRRRKEEIIRQSLEEQKTNLGGNPELPDSESEN